MNAKPLGESGWKAMLLKFKIKDNGLQRALAGYEKLPEDDYDERLKALAQIDDLATKLAKDKTATANQPVADYLEDITKEVARTESTVEELKKEADAGPVIPPDGHTSRGGFKNGNVKEIPITTKIINQIYRYFPKKYKVISAYLTPSDLYWKVNYHWDAMRVWLEYAKDHQEMDEEEQKQLNEFYRTIMSNPPSKTGHYKINKIGEPEDASSKGTIEQRCATLKRVKADLTAYAQKQEFAKKNMSQKNVLQYALNPLAMPKRSNHAFGWALDIAGDIPGAAAISKSLGATLAFKEFTHCHCEFKRGVKVPA